MSDNKSNLDLWEKVQQTDPDYTKYVSQRGGFTSVDATYQQRRATEQFGPFGSGWGISESEIDFSMFESTRMAMYKANFFYTINDVKHTFPIHNCLRVCTVKNDGTINVDENFAKKLETNTISKALSRLGFSADVFMGQFDDQDYVSQAATESSIAKAEDKDAEILEKRTILSDYVSRHLDALRESTTVSEANGIHKSVIRHLDRQKLIPEVANIADRGMRAISDLHKQSISKMENKNEAT